MSFVLQLAAFSFGGEIPRMFTCDGADLSPAFNWHGAPSGTQSFVLIVDDPDAPGGTWTHWVAWNIPRQATVLPQGVPKNETLDNGTRQGKNDFGRLGYGGPCPPPGKAHHYYFKLIAMNKRLELKAGEKRNALEVVIQGHILAQATWMGTYKR
jgi:Raf kinase inhibitor-like YbhB/YbcL family protein